MFKRFGTHLWFCPTVLRKYITVQMLISYLAQKGFICRGWKKVVTTTGGTELVIYILNFSRSKTQKLQYGARISLLGNYSARTSDRQNQQQRDENLWETASWSWKLTLLRGRTGWKLESKFVKHHCCTGCWTGGLCWGTSLISISVYQLMVIAGKWRGM